MSRHKVPSSCERFSVAGYKQNRCFATFHAGEIILTFVYLQMYVRSIRELFTIMILENADAILRRCYCVGTVQALLDVSCPGFKKQKMNALGIGQRRRIPSIPEIIQGQRTLPRCLIPNYD